MDVWTSHGHESSVRTTINITSLSGIIISPNFRNIFPAPKPTIPSHMESNLQLVNVIHGENNLQLHQFRLTCPTNCAIYIRAQAFHTRLGKWSLFEHLDRNNQSYPNSDSYVSNYFNLNLENRQDLEFSLEVFYQHEISNSFDQPSIIEVGVAAQYTAYRTNYAPEFVELLEKFPDWTTTTDWIYTYKSYEF